MQQGGDSRPGLMANEQQVKQTYCNQQKLMLAGRHTLLCIHCTFAFVFLRYAGLGYSGI